MAEDPKKLEEAKKLLQQINAIRGKMSKEPILDITSAEELPGLLAKARNELDDFEGSASNLYTQLRGITSEMKGQETSIQKARKGYRSITDIASKLASEEKEISKLGIKDLKTLQQKAKENKQAIADGAKELMLHNQAYLQIQKELDTFKELGASAEDLLIHREELLSASEKLTDEEKAILMSHFDQNSVLDDILEKTRERVDLEERAEKAAKGFTVMEKVVKSIPGLKGLAGPFENASTAAKDAYRSSQSGLKSFAAGGKALIKAFGPITMAISAFKFLKDIAFSIDNKQTGIAKSMALSSSEAEYQYKQFKGIKNSSDSTFITTKRLIGAQKELSDVLGTTRGFTAQQLEDQVEMTRTMGLQADTAGRLQALSMSSSQSADDALSSILDQTVALQMQTGIQLDNRKVIEEVAKTDGQLAANYKNNPGLIAKAVTQVRKLGLSLSKAKDMSSKLLDFESSISAEMEAELLTGKNLNLDRARALALQGDSAGAAAEMLKQVGSLEEFQNMNVIQQQALAAAVGMTSDELANSLTEQSNLNKLGGQTRKELEERVKKLREAGKIEEANALMSAAGNKEAAEEALRRQSIQDKFQDSMDRLKETFAEIFHENLNISEIANKIVGFFQNLSKNLGMIKGIAIALGTLFGAMAISSVITAVASMTMASAITLGLGAIAIAGGLAYMSSKMDETTDAQTEKVKSAQKTKTGNDTVIPAGYGNNVITGPKGSIALNNKDSIIAGTDLFGGKTNSRSTEKLMNKIDRLISIVEKGGNVYIDGNKVGEALVLSSKLSS